MPEPVEKPKVNLKFLYVMCNDVAEMRRFYADLLGMTATSFKNEPKFGWLAIKSDGMELMFFRSDSTLPVSDVFASQPGWPGGTAEVVSWSVHIPESDFAPTVKKLIAAGVKYFKPAPLWAQDSYWSFPVLDPMGHSVEVYTSPKQRPPTTDWSWPPDPQ